MMFQRVRTMTIGDLIELSLMLYPEQWVGKSDHPFSWTYENKRERWKLIRGGSPWGGCWLSLNCATLTKQEERRVNAALDALGRLRREQRRAEAVRKHYEKEHGTK